MPEADWRLHVARIFRAALRAVDPYRAVRRRLARGGLVPGPGPVTVLGAGKAAWPMARAVEDALGRRVAGGVIVTKEGHGGELRRVRLLEGTHPLPSPGNVEACRALVEAARRVPAGGPVLVLLSGGASALLTAPAPGVSLEDKAATTRLLLRAGAPIGELNCVRKHLSTVKGGGLARELAGRRVVALVLSDVIGDPLDVIASGPLVPDTSTYAEALGVLERRALVPLVPRSVLRHLRRGARGLVPETPKPGEPGAALIRHVIVGGNEGARRAAASAARRFGFRVLDLGSRLEGESRDVARSLCRSLLSRTSRNRLSLLVLAGGELTVTVRGRGRGGRAQEFALAAALALAGVEGAFAAGFATDGTDGPTPAAGALVDGSTAARALAMGLDPERSLTRNDSHGFFRRLGDLIETGPTGTNVGDLYLIGWAARPSWTKRRASRRG